eukprot:COSAG02_NODE_548_length_20472_cov_5.958524_1_plen_62_part_10
MNSGARFKVHVYTHVAAPLARPARAARLAVCIERACTIDHASMRIGHGGGGSAAAGGPAGAR